MLGNIFNAVAVFSFGVVLARAQDEALALGCTSLAAVLAISLALKEPLLGAVRNAGKRNRGLDDSRTTRAFVLLSHAAIVAPTLVAILGVVLLTA